jgi:long-chain fatty acid transport protein
MWAGLDMRMAASGAQLGGLVTGASGNLAAALPALGGAPWARIDFSNNNDFTGAAKSTGWAAKLGLVYKASDGLTLGASVPACKSSLKDMKTGAPASAERHRRLCRQRPHHGGRLPVAGHDLLGAAGRPRPPAAGRRRQAHRLGRRDEGLQLRYDSAGMGGSVSFALPQNWKDQTVTSLGVAYGLTADMTLRAGSTMPTTRSPMPMVNPLFPATVKTHYTLGMGYRFTTSQRAERGADAGQPTQGRHQRHGRAW